MSPDYFIASSLHRLRLAHSRSTTPTTLTLTFRRPSRARPCSAARVGARSVRVVAPCQTRLRSSETVTEPGNVKDAATAQKHGWWPGNSSTRFRNKSRYRAFYGSRVSKS